MSSVRTSNGRVPAVVMMRWVEKVGGTAEIGKPAARNTAIGTTDRRGRSPSRTVVMAPPSRGSEDTLVQRRAGLRGDTPPRFRGTVPPQKGVGYGHAPAAFTIRAPSVAAPAEPSTEPRRPTARYQ